MVARQMVALGDFVVGNLDFFLQFSQPETPNSFLPPLDGTAMGAAAENRPVIGSWQLAPDEALLLEVPPPEGLYWSYSLGNPWWETIDYAAHQSSLNGFQADVDRDGIVRAVVAHEDPGRGELARHRRPQRRADDPALRAHRDGARAHRPRAARWPRWPTRCRPRRAGSGPRNARPSWRRGAWP